MQRNNCLRVASPINVRGTAEYATDAGLKLIRFYKEERRKSRRAEPPVVGF